MRRSSILWALALIFTACSNRLEVPGDDARIGLRAGIGEVGVTTRATATPYQGTTPSTSNVLDASVWFSTTSGSYANTGATGASATLPLHTEIQFNSSGLVYPVSDVLLYPESGTVYCVGLYPYSASEWTNTNSSGSASTSHASHAINGSDDLMFAPQVSGTKESPISSPLAFTHQLTWLKFSVQAESHSAKLAWGNIESISVTSPYSRLTVDLSAGTASCNGASTDISAFSGSEALKISLQQLGSVFCAPATEYQVSVTTAYLGTKNLTVGLKGLDGSTPVGTADAAKGKMFVITLSFKDVDMIDATCTLNTWDDIYQKIEGS